MKKRKIIRIISRILFGIYMIVLVYFLLLSDGFGRMNGQRELQYNLVPFQEIKRFIVYWKTIGVYYSLINLAGNVVAFMPFGALIRWVVNQKTHWYQAVGYTFAFSLCVELLQLVARVGVFDVDDLILNTLGAAVGYLFFAVCNYLRRKQYGKKI